MENNATDDIEQWEWGDTLPHDEEANDGEHTSPTPTRRGVMKGIGGLAALSMSGATAAEAQDALTTSLPSDPHTLATYRSIVDAIIPRTPELEDELGPEHVPGGLDIELEKFLIWDFNHFQEIRAEMVTKKVDSPAVPEMPMDLLETTLDATGASSALDALLDLTEVSLLGFDLDLDLGYGEDALNDHLTFGALNRLDLSLKESSMTTAGPAVFDLVVETANETIHRVVENYPYAPLFALVFDVIAAEFIVRGKNEDPLVDGTTFPGGGTFVRLSREDRLRCLWTIVDGSVVDRLDTLLSPLLPQLGILKFVVMAVNGLHGFGYYTEWSGYGDTKMAMPNERELATPAGEVQSRQQTEYPGPAPGYAADWKHIIDGGFKDSMNLTLPNDLTGDDVIEGIGGDES
jgi:hypothetical protein